MSETYEIRASYDKESLVLWQAFSDKIAAPALRAQAFVEPFSFRRMTWIKPSFAWLMHRSRWGQKDQQTKILAVHISRSAWERALAMGVLTDPHPGVYGSAEDWRRQFESAKVHIQWDTERDLRGQARPHYSIQVGLSRHVIEDYAQNWILRIEDFTPRVRKIRELIKRGKRSSVSKLLYREKPYPLPGNIARGLGIPVRQRR
ncbi:MAG: DUF4291 domain-containing protein [Planctomycetota bacterium]|nr:DUF4291 domain-containing protein [Planctomycetota bacterium]